MNFSSKDDLDWGRKGREREREKEGTVYVLLHIMMIIYIFLSVLRSGFEEQDYSGREGPDRRSILPRIPCTVTIRLQGTTIEDDLTFRLTPRTVPENTNMGGPPPTGELRNANASSKNM